MKLVVVGAGIAGLSGAWYARREAELLGVTMEVTVLEAGGRLGGKLWTERTGDAVLEWGPDSFLARKPEARALVRDVGLESELIAPSARRAFLLLGGELRPLPAGLAMGVPLSPRASFDAARAGILSPAAAARAALEPTLPGRPIDRDESAAGAAARRLGREAAARLVAPLVEGVFGSPATGVAAGATWPGAVGRRSLALSLRGTPRRPGPVFLGLRGGMDSLVRRLVDGLPEVAIHRAEPATSIDVSGEGYIVRTAVKGYPADGVLMATTASAAATLLERVAPAASSALGGVRYGRSAVVHLRYPTGSLGRPVNGSGYLAADEGAVAACSWTTAKWPHVASAGPWLRAIVTRSPALDLSDDHLLERVAREVGAVMRAPDPLETRMSRWPEALPVYGPGHRARVAEARNGLPTGVELAGAYVDGFGVPDCIRTARDAVHRLVRGAARK